MPTGRGRLLYRINNDSSLYGRGFSVENGLISSLQHRVSGPGVDGTDWTGTNSLTVIDGKLYHSHSDGTLRRTDLVERRAGHGHHRDHQRPGGRRPRTGRTRSPCTPGARPHLRPRRRLRRRTTSTRTTSPTSTGGPPCRASPSTPPPAPRRAPRRRPSVTSTAPGPSPVGPSAPPTRRSAARSRSGSTGITTTTVLMRLRTADNLAGGRVFVTANGTLYIRSDVAGVQTSSGCPAHHRHLDGLELCATAGASGTLTLAVNGTPGRLLHRGHGDAPASAWSRSARRSTTTGPPTSTTWSSPSPPSASKSGIPPAMGGMAYGWTQPRCVRLRRLPLRNVTGSGADTCWRSGEQDAGGCGPWTGGEPGARRAWPSVPGARARRGHRAAGGRARRRRERQPGRHDPTRPGRQHAGRGRPREPGHRGRQVRPGEALQPGGPVHPEQHLRLRQGDRRDRHHVRPAARRPGHRDAEGGRRQHLRRRAVQERQRGGRRLPREAEPRHRCRR